MSEVIGDRGTDHAATDDDDTCTAGRRSWARPYTTPAARRNVLSFAAPVSRDVTHNGNDSDPAPALARPGHDLGPRRRLRDFRACTSAGTSGFPRAGRTACWWRLAVVTILYVAFVLGYAELACALPKAGGAFVYTTRAFGPHVGFLGGVAQLVEYALAPPAIAFAIGSYINQVGPGAPVIAVAFAAYIVFTAINIVGVKMSAAFELVLTVVAVIELCVFGVVVLPQFSLGDVLAATRCRTAGAACSRRCRSRSGSTWRSRASRTSPKKRSDPQRDLPRGFFGSMGTLVVLTAITLFGAVGAAGWHAVVYTRRRPHERLAAAARDRACRVARQPAVRRADRHRPRRARRVFHGILIAASRALLEMGRARWRRRALGEIHPRRARRSSRCSSNMGVGFVALLTGHTDDIILIAVFGALALYILSSAAVIALRRQRARAAAPVSRAALSVHADPRARARGWSASSRWCGRIRGTRCFSRASSAVAGSASSRSCDNDVACASPGSPPDSAACGSSRKPGDCDGPCPHVEDRPHRRHRAGEPHVRHLLRQVLPGRDRLEPDLHRRAELLRGRPDARAGRRRGRDARRHVERAPTTPTTRRRASSIEEQRRRDGSVRRRATRARDRAELRVRRRQRRRPYWDVRRAGRARRSLLPADRRAQSSSNDMYLFRAQLRVHRQRRTRRRRDRPGVQHRAEPDELSRPDDRRSARHRRRVVDLVRRGLPGDGRRRRSRACARRRRSTATSA